MEIGAGGEPSPVLLDVLAEITLGDRRAPRVNPGAIEHERDNLQKVRGWIAAGQGRDGGAPATAPSPRGAAGAGAPMPAGGGTAGEFTFTADSPVDAHHQPRDFRLRPEPERRHFGEHLAGGGDRGAPDARVAVAGAR